MRNTCFNSLLIFSGVLGSGNLLFAQEKPNIVVFIADDAGMDFGCYGNLAIKAPNIDRIAKQGVRFQNAFLTSPQSSSSHCIYLYNFF